MKKEKKKNSQEIKEHFIFEHNGTHRDGSVVTCCKQLAGTSSVMP